jgi:hypothetical protein
MGYGEIHQKKKYDSVAMGKYSPKEIGKKK